MIKTTSHLNGHINKLFWGAAFCVSLLLAGNGIFAQLPSVNTTINRSNILIGEPIEYRIRVSLPPDAVSVKWFNIPDSIAHFEVVERSKIDSADANGSVNLSQVISLTSFDSGRYMIPAFELNITRSNSDSTLRLYTDSMAINVSYSPLDSTKTFHDIKAIIEVSDKWPWWMWAILGGSIVLGLFIIIYLVRIYKKKKQQRSLFNSKLSPYDEAMASLQELQKQQLLMNGEANRYHTGLSNIFRRYVSRKSGRNMMTMTSAEMLVVLNSSLTSDYTSALAASLRMGDAVKFAKYVPPVVESEDALNHVKRVIEKMNHIDNDQNQPI